MLSVFLSSCSKYLTIQCQLVVEIRFRGVSLVAACDHMTNSLRWFARDNKFTKGKHRGIIKNVSLWFEYVRILTRSRWTWFAAFCRLLSNIGSYVFHDARCESADEFCVRNGSRCFWACHVQGAVAVPVQDSILQLPPSGDHERQSRKIKIPPEERATRTKQEGLKVCSASASCRKGLAGK